MNLKKVQAFKNWMLQIHPVQTNFVNSAITPTTSHRGQVYQEQAVHDLRDYLGQFLRLDKEH